MRIRFLATVLPVFAFGIPVCYADSLSSWNDTAAKKAIIDFVERLTNKGSPDFVKPKERIATVDNDGTLWVEQPNYDWKTIFPPAETRE